MKSQKKKFNGAVVTSFIKVCYTCQDLMTEQDKMRIKQFTDFLQKRFSVADCIICEGTVKGLVLQHKIEEALETIRKNESTCSLNRHTYSAAATCLLDMGHFDKGKDFVEESLPKVTTLLDEVYLKWIEKSSNSEDRLEKLLKIFQVNDIKPTKLVCDHLLAAFRFLPEKKKMIGSYGTIDNR